MELIYNFSPLLEISSIHKSDKLDNNDTDILYFIKTYEAILHSNNYGFLFCPRCRGHHLKYYRTYKRNLVLHINGYLIEAKLEIIVVECCDCAHEHDKNNDVQFYHAILPEGAYPYHIFSSSIILNSLNDKMNKIKNEIILERYRVSRQLLKFWLDLLNRYRVSSSTILKTNIDLRIIIESIIKSKDDFHHHFYNNYLHPFFLNRITCVPLAITP